jgi:hypothetical protein
MKPNSKRFGNLNLDIWKFPSVYSCDDDLKKRKYPDLPLPAGFVFFNILSTSCLAFSQPFPQEILCYKHRDSRRKHAPVPWNSPLGAVENEHFLPPPAYPGRFYVRP